MKPIKHLGIITIIFTGFFLLSSCFGLQMDIALNQNGSGILSLEYRISKSLDSIGKLDGNERWNTIPAGKADFERTLARLPEMKLLSFSSKEDEKDVIISAKMEFSSISGLMSFLDASGRRSSFTGNAGGGRLLITLSEGAGINNPDLRKLIKDISAPYSINMSMNFQGEGNLEIFDNNGTSLEPQKQGKKLSFSFPLYDVISSGDGIKAAFSW